MRQARGCVRWLCEFDGLLQSHFVSSVLANPLFWPPAVGRFYHFEIGIQILIKSMHVRRAETQ